MELTSNCIIVKGSYKSALVDLQRQNLITILTEEMDQYFDENDKFDLELLKAKNSDFYNYLSENDCIIPKIVNQKKMPTNWDFAGEITNVIIHLNGKTDLSKSTVKELDKLGAEAIVLVLMNTMNVVKLLNLFIGTNITSISIFSKAEYLNANTIKKIDDPRLKSTYLLESEVAKIESTDTGQFIVHSKEKFDAMKGCGHISSDFFSLDIFTYTESLHHNSCLNRKISIDSEGNIKNCPSMIESFGNIRDTTLSEAIDKPNFKKYWDINKDKIHVCKDCEFRYICTDCRAYVEDPEDILSKPLKCGYNPYTGEWSEWSNSPLKQKAIDFYGLRDFVE